ncbi:MAG: hypothetical protein Q8M07_13165, partial [Prosthecobacter sp.]|nr:hypothetical protein [Prosthecobacter sp.]
GPFNVEDAIHIAPLRVHPLVKLSLGGTRVADFHSLRGNATLEEITLPYLASELQNGVRLDSSPSIQTLRHFPQLKNIIFLDGISLYPYTYGAFWKAVARGDRVLGLLRKFRNH